MRKRVCLWLALLAAPWITADERPNVVIFYADDMGIGDLSCYGAKDLRTPNLDRLARQGVRMTSYYSAAPVCSPSRTALLTGRYPIRAGVPGNVSSQPNRAGLPTTEITLAELAKTHGYRTGLVGKWHQGTTPETDPVGQGFDFFFGHRGGCIDFLSHYFYWTEPNFHDLWKNRTEVFEFGEHFTELIVRESVRFIDRNRSKPFLLYVAFNAPHYPMQAPRRFTEMHADLPFARREYAAHVSHLDESLGRIVDHLERRSLRENTLVFFMSDNGHSVERRANGGGGSAGPYRGHKFSLFEGGIRMPCLVSWPAGLPKGEVRDSLAIAMDVFPTIAAAIGAQLPGDRRLDGASLLPILRSKAAPAIHDSLFWQSGRGQKAVRQGGWKLVIKPRLDNEPGVTAPQVSLVDLAGDPGERRSVAATRPEVVKRLRDLHAKWLADVRQRDD